MLPGFAVISLLFHWDESQGSIAGDFLPIRALSGFSKTLYHWHHLTFELETHLLGKLALEGFSPALLWKSHSKFMFTSLTLSELGRRERRKGSSSAGQFLFWEHLNSSGRCWKPIWSSCLPISVWGPCWGQQLIPIFFNEKHSQGLFS